jgi:DNA polymerase-1
MAVIKSKRRSVIKKGTNFSYNPETFTKEHSVDFFHEAKSAQEIIDNIVPFEINGRKFIVFDTETYPTPLKSNEIPNGLVRRWVGSGKSAKPQDLPFCISICDGKNAYTLHDTLDNNYNEFRKLAAIFEDPSIEKIAHNWKFDAHMLQNINMRIKGKVHDTVVLTKLTDENRSSYQLKDIARKYEGHIVKFEYMLDAYKNTHKIADYRMFPRELINNYANADVWNCYLVFINEFPLLEKYGLMPLYENEMELMIALYAAERYGMKVDLDYEKQLKTELQTLTDNAEAAIYEEAGKIFNVNSSKQLYEVLMGLGVDDRLIPRTDKGSPQTNKYILSDLSEKHNVTIARKILEYRKYEKLLTTYAVGIYDQRSAEGKVHGNINQTEATTGRMSITKPALQTLPKKDTSIRRAFIPSDGYELWMMDLDYSNGPSKTSLIAGNPA